MNMRIRSGALSILAAAMLAGCAGSDPSSGEITGGGRDARPGRDIGADRDVPTTPGDAGDAGTTPDDPSPSDSNDGTAPPDGSPPDTGAPSDASPDASPDAGGTCGGLPTCVAEGTFCEGSNLVICRRTDAGCIARINRNCETEVEDGRCVADTTGALCESRCKDIANCALEGLSCEGATLVSCAPNSEGCLVSARTDCAAAAVDGFCDTSGTEPACAVPPDPCDGVTECNPATFASTCENDAIVSCVPNPDGCPVFLREPCEGDTLACGRIAGEPSCVAAACAGVDQCDPAVSRPRCDGTSTVTCGDDANGCAVETRVDCAATSLVCDNGTGTPRCVEPQLCPAAVPLTCASGTVRARTAEGTSEIRNYSCLSGNYPGNERIFSFRAPVNVAVSLTTRAVGSTTCDHDLVVLRGQANQPCSGSLACVANSTNTAVAESVSFNATANELLYIAFDRYSSCSSNVEFDLTIACTGCGDGVVSTGEGCDDGNLTPGDGCSATCTIEDGFVCTGGTPSVCERRVCGDGRQVTGEACDDGNTAPGDGCSATCTREDGFVCSGTAPTTCRRILCGDSRIDAPEACDDGNTASGDGCSDTCQREPGFVCQIGPPTVCTVTSCGDDVITDDEACDDGNQVSGDGCSDTCQIENGYICFGEPSTCSNGGNTCNPPLLVGPGTYALNTTAYTNALSGYGGDCEDCFLFFCDDTYFYGRDIVLAFDVPARGSFTVRANTSWDAVLVHLGACRTGDCLGWADDLYSGTEVLSATNNTGSTLRAFVVLDGLSSSDYGPANVTIEIR